MFTAHIKRTDLDFAIQKFNLTTKWPVLQEDDEWDESLWYNTEFYRYIVHRSIRPDLVNTSKRALHVGSPFSQNAFSNK